MKAINGLIDQAATKCAPPNDSGLAARMHLSRSAVSLWRKGGAIKEKHLTALIVLADVDEVTALEVLAEQAETKPEKAVWHALLQRVGATTALVLCAIGFLGTMPGKAYAARHPDSWISGDTRDNAYYVKADWGWWARLARWWLEWKLRGSRSTPGRLDACRTA